MQTLKQIKEILESRGLAPRKALGQNFLIDQNLVKKLVDAAGLVPGATVLEVGPGTGTMTEELLDRGCHVIAAELDAGLAAALRERFASRCEQFVMVEGDCLAGKRALNPGIVQAVGAREFALVSNLPYGAATPVMNILMASFPACRVQCVTIQLEVAQRLMAKPGSKEFGPLAVLAQTTSEVEFVAKLPPERFSPRPEVHSAMVILRRRAQPLCEDAGGLADLVQEVLGQRRKQLGAVLGRGIAWPEGIEPTQRGENLSIAQWVQLRAAIRGGAKGA